MRCVGKSGKVETTVLYKLLYEAAGDIKPKNISIDTLSRAFAGNEIDRVQVYAFAIHMQALAMVAGGSVTVLSHPSLAGIASGSGISGSDSMARCIPLPAIPQGPQARSGRAAGWRHPRAPVQEEPIRPVGRVNRRPVSAWAIPA